MKARACLLLASLLPLTGGAAPELGAARKAELRNMLVQDCGSCHGLLMRGGLGPQLLPQRLAAVPDAVLLDAILNGRPGTAMPAWGALVSQPDARWMLDQLRRGIGR